MEKCSLCGEEFEPIGLPIELPSEILGIELPKLPDVPICPACFVRMAGNGFHFVADILQQKQKE